MKKPLQMTIGHGFNIFPGLSSYSPIKADFQMENNRHKLLTLTDITTDRLPELTKGNAPIILLASPVDLHAVIDLIRDCNAKGRPIECGYRGPIVL